MDQRRSGLFDLQLWQAQRKPTHTSTMNPVNESTNTKKTDNAKYNTKIDIYSTDLIANG